VTATIATAPAAAAPASPPEVASQPRVSDENADPFTHTVTVTVARLRRKLGGPDLIETVIGSGYRLP